ncbi:MAG: hypothetical protein OES41_04285, partial [Rhodospirillales bacterium]|nr:hypothetical protein [Rhodospirillales bacterium]
LSATLGSGQGAGYPSSGHVRIGREVIEYTGNAADVLSWPDTGHRGAFGTTADSASEGAQVQICRTWTDIPATTVLQDILEDAGIATADIDTAGFAAEELDWLGPAFNVTTAITAPEDASKLLADLVALLRGIMWWDPVAQKVRFEVFAPLTPVEMAAATLTDDANMIAGSTSVEPRDDLRSTVRALYYGLISPVENRREQANYLRAQIFVDADAESANEYDDRRVVTTFSRWWAAANDAAALAVISRAAGYYRDAPLKLEARVAAKDAALREGDQVDVQMGQLVDFDGATRTLRCIVTRRQDQGGEIALRLRSTGFALRYGFVAPNTAGDYPADDEWAHVAPDAGFSDGSDSYAIF